MTKLELMRLSESLSNLYTGLETDLIANIAEYLANGNIDSPTAQWKIQMLARLGALDKMNIRTIAGYAGIAPEMLTEALETAALTAIGELEPGFQKLAADGIIKGAEVPIERTMAKALISYRKQARQSLNMVNTVMRYKAKSAAQKIINDTAELAQKQSFIDMLNKAAGKAVTGIESRQAAMRQCIKEMSEKGIPAFVDKSGREWSPEAYINMDIRTTANNAAHQAQFDRMDDYGLDLIEVSSHAGARPKCAEDQGKIFNRKNKDGYTTDLHGRKIKYYSWKRSSFGEPDGLLGINCGHKIYPFIPGVSYQTYFPYDEYENREQYKKIQGQRELERRVRKSKRECMALETTGDTEGLQKAQAKLKERQQALKQYCADNDLRYKPNRTAVVDYKKSAAGFTPSDKKNKIAQIKAKAVDKSDESGTSLKVQTPKKPTKLERMRAELEESKKKTQQSKNELVQLYMDKKNITYEEAKAKVDAIENKVRKKAINPLDKSAQGGIIKEEKHDYKYLSPAEMPEWRKSTANCSDKDYNQIYSHNGGGYIRTPNSFRINRALRNNDLSSLSDDDKITIKTLQSVIADNSTDRDVILTRYVREDYISKNFGFDPVSMQSAVNRINNKFAGIEVEEKGFMSTSYDSSKNVFCNYPIKMVIQAPKGTHMFATKNYEESEVIFMSNTKYKVLSAKILDNKEGSRQIEILCTVIN